MTIMALIMMVGSMSMVTAFTVYFFVKVLKAPDFNDDDEPDTGKA